MARTQRVTVIDGTDTYTVVGADHLPARDYLQFLRDNDASPNTVKATHAGQSASDRACRQVS